MTNMASLEAAMVRAPKTAAQRAAIRRHIMQVMAFQGGAGTPGLVAEHGQFVLTGKNVTLTKSP